jgi:hypothetical protein
MLIFICLYARASCSRSAAFTGWFADSAKYGVFAVWIYLVRD